VALDARAEEPPDRGEPVAVALIGLSDLQLRSDFAHTRLI
jgi:hypothetical protein